MCWHENDFFDDDDHHDVEDGILLLSLKVLSIFSSTYRKDLGAIETTERLFLSLLIEVLEPAQCGKFLILLSLQNVKKVKCQIN